MTDNNVNHLLEIPEFLQRDYDPLKWLEKYSKRKDEIVQIKQARLERKKRKNNIEVIVLEAIQRKYNTFGEMMSIVSDVSEAEMRGAIRRLMKDNKVVKLSRRVYGVKL